MNNVNSTEAVPSAVAQQKAQLIHTARVENPFGNHASFTILYFGTPRLQQQQQQQQQRELTGRRPSYSNDFEEATLTCEDVTGVCHDDVLTDEQCHTLIKNNVPTNDTSNLQIASVLILLTDVKEEECYSERERKMMQMVIDTMKQKVQQDKQERQQQQKRQIRVSFYSQKAGMPNGCY
mmetsp:Transcript_2439/g.2701  ORF Transcript_2439/g.2701 Transcript_2439/m.2701 type:complete len:179 (-) Transcript_2439:213-749(-)